MPSDGYTTVPISDETAVKLVEIVGVLDLKSVAEAFDFAADAACDPETFSEPS